jgi:hypothetical protein
MITDQFAGIPSLSGQAAVFGSFCKKWSVKGQEEKWA